MDCSGQVPCGGDGEEQAVSPPQKRSRPADRLFALTFNSNEKELNEANLRDLFADVGGAGVVVVSFQEYDFSPANPVPGPPMYYEGPAGQVEDLKQYIRTRGGDTAELDTARVAAIGAVLGEGAYDPKMHHSEWRRRTKRFA